MMDTNLHIDDEKSSGPSLRRSISMTSLRNRVTTTTTSEIHPVLSLQEGIEK